MTNTSSYDARLQYLNAQANHALKRWHLPADAQASLLNVSENTTYRVESANGLRAILRIHRDNYHTCNAIRCEHAWLQALSAEGVVATPRILAGHDGDTLQAVAAEGRPGEHYMALFEFVEGHAPDPQQNLTAAFEALGAIAAKTHNHAAAWHRPRGFTRPTWDLDAVFGAPAKWGDWRAAPHVNASIRGLLEAAQTAVETALQRYGKTADRYGLIHADMRLANLLINDQAIHLIDFDDCGFGWFMYDFAASISFIEDDPQIPQLQAAWLCGYRKHRPLRVADETQLQTLIMLRRLALLAWIGSHREVPTAQEVAPHFAAGSAALAEAYLSRLTH